MKKRCAYTLVEMLIVMLLLTILVGLAWPMLRSPWGQTKLQDAAEQVRAAMADARREAISSVEPWQFCYRIGSSDYLIGPLKIDDENADKTNDTDTNENSASLDLDLNQETSPSEFTIRQLPHDVIFCNPQSDQELGADAVEANLEESFPKESSGESATTAEPGHDTLSPDDLAAELESGEWSQPIVFFPNGRSTSDLLRLRSTAPDIRLITIRVRGIVGAAKIGKPRPLRSADSMMEPTSEEETPR